MKSSIVVGDIENSGVTNLTTHACIPIKLLFFRLLVEDEIGTLTIQGDGKSHG